MKNILFKILATAALLVSTLTVFSQGLWEYGINSTIGTRKVVGIGTYAPLAGTNLNIIDTMTYGSTYNVFATNLANGVNMKGLFTARLNSCGDFSPQGQGASVMGNVTGLTLLKANSSGVLARAAGGYFSTNLSNLVINNASGSNYEVAGCIAILNGTVGASGYPTNKVYAGLYAVDAIKSNLNTWAGYFDGNVCVLGTIRTTEVKVKVSPWADFVFADTYKLSTLQELEKYIKANRHLPGIPKEDEVNNDGVSLGEMNVKLLQKVEELTLYIIEQDKRITELESKIKN